MSGVFWADLGWNLAQQTITRFGNANPPHSERVILLSIFPWSHCNRALGLQLLRSWEIRCIESSATVPDFKLLQMPNAYAAACRLLLESWHESLSELKMGCGSLLFRSWLLCRFERSHLIISHVSGPNPTIIPEWLPSSSQQQYQIDMFMSK